MKKILLILMSLLMAVTMAACAPKDGGKEAEPWSTEGYFTDADEHMLTVTYMEEVTDPGWYVGLMIGDDMMNDSYGGTLPQQGNSLQGTLTCTGDNDPIKVTVTPEGENGMTVVVEGGETYHFVKTELPQATIIVHVNTEGFGNIEYLEGEGTPEYDPERPYQSAQINLADPTTYTFLAWTTEEHKFVKWTKNGEDFSTEPQITVLLDESADFVAVFE